MGRTGWVPKHARRLVFWRRRAVYVSLATIAAVGLGVPLLVNTLDQSGRDPLIIVTDPTPWVGGPSEPPLTPPEPTVNASAGVTAASPTPTPQDPTPSADTPAPSSTGPGGGGDGTGDSDGDDGSRPPSRPTTSPSSPPSSSLPPATPGCSAEFDVDETWSSGFTAELTVTNLSSDEIVGWKVTFSLQANYKVIWLWGGRVSQDGQMVTITGQSNDSIGPGRSRTFGFVVSGEGTPKPPNDVALSGASCG
jgi:hypothetical protein